MNKRFKKLTETGDVLAEMVLGATKAGTIAPHDALAAVTAWAHLLLRSEGVKLKPDKDG